MKYSLLIIFLVFRLAGTLTAQAPQIVLPPNANQHEARAAQVLQFYLQKMTRQTVRIQEQAGGPKAPTIFIGRSQEAQKAGFDMPLDMPGEAFFTAGKQNKFAIAGGGDMGAEYGVYTLLELLGCRKYSPVDSFIPDIKQLRLPDCAARVETPAFPYRELWYEPAFNEAWARWHKLKTNPVKNREWGLFVHTFDRLCPHEKYFSEHPEYYAFNGAQHSPGQLCLSNDTVLQIVIASLRELIAQKPEARYWSVSQNDNYDYCKCARCAATDAQNGGPSGSLIAFVNQVAAAFPDKTISTLAYQYTRQAPRVLKPAQNVNICLCSIECNRGKSIENGCTDFAGDVRAWAALTDNLMIWDYVVQFRSYISPFPNWHTLQPNLQFFQQNGVRMMFEQGSGRSRSEFSDMRAYLLAKLMWNPNVAVDSILNDFGQGYYGAGWPQVQAYVQLLTDNLAKHGNGLWIYDIPQNEAFLTQEDWSVYHRTLLNALEVVGADSARIKRTEEALLPVWFARLEKTKKDTVLLNDYVRDGLAKELEMFDTYCKKMGINTLHENNYLPENYRADYLAFFDKHQKVRQSQTGRMLSCSPPSTTYARGNSAVLSDHLIGETDYRYNWLGFQGADLEVVAEVNGAVPVSMLELSFLQDQQSWVFFPKKVTLEISADGDHFKVVQEVNIPVERSGQKAVKVISGKFPPQVVKSVRIRAENIKRCPAWHNCNGSPCWIFVDEIVVGN